MTAIQLHRSPGEIIVATDTALGVSGDFVARISKTEHLPRINAITAFRGIPAVIAMYRFALLEVECPEQLAGSLPLALRELQPLPKSEAVEFVVGGVDSNGRDFAFLYESHPASAEPFEARELSGSLVAPLPDLSGFHDQTFETTQAAAGWIFQRQRQMPEILIGGEAIIHHIDRHGITTKLLGTWPDKAGHRVDKSALLQFAS